LSFFLSQQGSICPAQAHARARVTQSCTLLYRRFSICKSSRQRDHGEPLPITNRRPSRLEICVTHEFETLT
jgi:hypothetical protein